VYDLDNIFSLLFLPCVLLPRPPLLLLLQASVYDLYDLLSLCADQLPAAPPKAAGSSKRGPGKKQAAAAAPAIETEALATCARIVGAVTPGSSAHADLTTEYMVRWGLILCCCCYCSNSSYSNLGKGLACSLHCAPEL
jgi:hypothetical protein